MNLFSRIFNFFQHLAFRKKIDIHFFFPKVKPFKANHENTAIVSILNDDFVEYFEKFASSILKHNPNFEFPWYIYFEEEISPLSNESKKRIKKIYKNVLFKEVELEKYSKFKNLVPNNLFPAILKLELFKLKGFKKILCLDVDTLCLGNLDYLLDNDFNFACAQAGTDYRSIVKNSGSFKRNIAFNTGIVIFGEELLKEGDLIHSRIMRYNSYCETAEQTIYNIFFRFYPVYILPLEYNFFADKLYKFFDSHKVRILHYTGPKPHKNKDAPLADLWLSAEKHQY